MAGVQGSLGARLCAGPWTEPNLFTDARVSSVIEDLRGDIRDVAKLGRAMHEFAPEVVFHMAAQPLVRFSYEDPLRDL
jgi:CDP-glucose 4,6-dehydratase